MPSINWGGHFLLTEAVKKTASQNGLTEAVNATINRGLTTEAVAKTATVNLFCPPRLNFV